MEIIPDKEELKFLLDKYKSSKEELEKWVKFNKKKFSKVDLETLEKWGFEKGKKEVFNNKIKESLTFIIKNYRNSFVIDEEHMQILKNPKLLEIVNSEFDKFIVNEEDTRKALFICGCGSFVKNLAATFNVLINAESSAGKSWITKNVLEIFPDRVFSKQTYRTRISSKALTYWHNSEVEPDWSWDGRILYLEDIGNDILNSDVFKVMVSEGSTATIVGKKKGSGSELPATFDIDIKGKPITFITTAIGTPIEEIKNRFLMIDVDESEEQTELIMQRQIENSIKGTKEEYDKIIKEALSKLHRVNVLLPPWIEKIKYHIPRKDILRWRREFPRFLEIVKCSAALHQFQRERNDENNQIMANEQDYEIARKVIGKVSASSGAEGLTKRERKAYEFIRQFYKENQSGATRKTMHAYRPIYSDKQWYNLLDKLSEKGLLSIKLETNPETNRKNSYYYPVEFNNLNLPKFTDLLNSNGNNGSNALKPTDKEKHDSSKKGDLHKNKGISSITSTTNNEWSESDKKRMENAKSKDNKK